MTMGLCFNFYPKEKNMKKSRIFFAILIAGIELLSYFGGAVWYDMLFFGIGGLLVFLKFEEVMKIPRELFASRGMVLTLAKNDFKTRFAGSYFGFFWALVNPIVTILLYYFIFTVAFHSGPVNGKPYVLWMVGGLVPWFLFQEGLSNGTNALIEYTYLVKKVSFQVSVLPVIKIVSASFFHLFFVVIMTLIYTVMGYFPGITMIQLIYYYVCMVVLLMAIDYATCAIVVFFRDLGQIIGIFMQVFMWLTPILWNDVTQLQAYPTLQFIFKLNPMYYVVEGYRDSMLDHIWLVEQTRLCLGLYFWGAVMILFVIGTGIYKKLKPHFADVL